MALKHLFVTIRFSHPFRDYEGVSRMFDELRRQIDTPMVLTFEQKGRSLQLLGALPHIHMVIMDVQGGRYQRVRSVIDSAMGPLRDVHYDRVGDYRLHYLVHHFMGRMERKGRPIIEKQMTRLWRRREGLPTSLRHKRIMALTDDEPGE